MGVAVGQTRVGWLALVWACSVACSGGASPAADADAGGGDGDGGGMEITPPEPPNIPWLDAGQPEIAPPAPPVLTPCPDGWHEVTDPQSGTVTCDPWSETGYEECSAVDEAHFPGEPGCTRIGTACTDDPWASDLPTDQPILYVLSGAPAGGDGTRASPFGTIAEATDAATSGTVVALSKGAFDEVVLVGSDVTLWGACVAETTVASTSGGLSGTISTVGHNGIVRNLCVGGEGIGTRATGAGRSLGLQDILVSNAVGMAIVADHGAALNAHNLVVRDTRNWASDGVLGFGLGAQTGAQVEVTRAVIERNRLFGVAAAGAGTTLTMTDVVVRHTQGQESDPQYGRGLEADTGAQVAVTRAVFERNHDVGVLASDVGTTLGMTDVVVRDTQSQGGDLQYGQGLYAQEGTQVTVARALFERNRTCGAFATGGGTTLDVTDAVIRDTRGQESDGGWGHGLEAQYGAQATVTRVVIERNRQVGVVAASIGTTLGMTDVVVGDTQSQASDLQAGGGLQVQEGCRVSVARTVFEHNRAFGVAAAGAGTTLGMADVVVRDTQGQESDLQYGRGLEAVAGAQVTVIAAVFEQNRDGGVFASDVGTTLGMIDVVVRDTESRESDRDWGRGLQAQQGSQVTAVRAVFERNREFGVFVGGDGTRLGLSDVVVRDTQSRESDGGDGEGLGLFDGARAAVGRAIFDTNHQVGVVVGDAATMLDLTDVVIRNTQSQESSRRWGRGLQAQDGAVVTVERAIFERNHEIGIIAANAVVRLAETIVRDTLERDCATDSCAGNGAGTGVCTLAGGHVEATRFIIARSALCGIQLALGRDLSGIPSLEGGTADLHEGEVSFNAVCGANIQTEDFNIDRIALNVWYHDNAGMNLDMTELPVPEVGTPIGE
jgi:hypothetical protein